MASMQDPVIEKIFVNRKLLNEHKIEVPSHSVYAYCWAVTVGDKRSYFATEAEAQAFVSPAPEVQTNESVVEQEAEAGA